MIQLTIYETYSGLIKSHWLGPENQISCNISDGCSAILGHWDAGSSKVDHNTGQIEDYTSPQPSPNHVWNGETKRWEYIKTPEDYAKEVREARDRIISSTDWVVTKATENSSPIPLECKTYRDALRDIPKQEGFPKAVIWPVKPE